MRTIGFRLGIFGQPRAEYEAQQSGANFNGNLDGLAFQRHRRQKYRTCAECKVTTRELAWHPQRLCPISAKFKSDGARTSAHAQQQQHQRRQVLLGEAKHEFLCHMCGMPSHTRRQCDQQHQTKKGKVAEQLYWEKLRGQVPRNQQHRPGKRHVMFVDQE